MDGFYQEERYHTEGQLVSVTFEEGTTDRYGGICIQVGRMGFTACAALGLDDFIVLHDRQEAG